MSDNSNNQLVIRANFNFQQKNEDKLSFTKGDIIHITLGILMLTTGSTVHMCLDKYPVLLKELERHMEVYHPDRQDTQESMTTFKNHSVQCQEVWKRKELELQILTGAIRSWEGNNIKTLGSIVYMSQPLAALCYKEDLSKSSKTMKKLLPKRRPEWKPSDKELALRKNTAALEEDAQILKVIKAYCTSAKTWQTFN
ncbi:hypothetical protein ABFV05_020366 [Capra hircus]